ncbi:hypothetical protein BO94DRAFT_194455 [Aspergillus sclerotioniger CBS 115572]|uniref:Uncharacterized protein n=1 Tax=Aspergillus sclerotioniger CBS 115572 TaxID=1450535 RepID=A0A317VSB5_9EURO|nr:hypothetical protein BO94DRAFT_194455 [Aspergillus sclerotioniger CBS 115572]PWY77226.1 hypothetical protein BO94DRAFT_194455 [Aspergillus sclerotioniger CBS 115572]
MNSQLSIFMPPSVFALRRLSAILGPSQTACLAPWSRFTLVYMMFTLCCTNLSLRFPSLCFHNFSPIYGNLGDLFLHSLFGIIVRMYSPISLPTGSSIDSPI